MKEETAYWLSPKGDILPVGQTHIKYIIDNPQDFKLTSSEIKSIYDKYGESLNFEGKARNEIMLAVLKKGWVRMRFYQTRQRYGWSLELWDFDDYSKNIIYKWAAKGMGLLESTNFGANTSVTIVDLKSYEEKRPEFMWKFEYTLKSIVEGKIYESENTSNIVSNLKLPQFIELDNVDYTNVGNISEASLSRVLSFVQDKEFVIITTYRNDKTKSENKLSNKQLLNDLNSKKMGPYNIIGHFVENSNIDVIEDAFLIVKPDEINSQDFKEYFIRKCNQYNQECVLYSTGGIIFYLMPDGELVKIGTRLVLNKLERAYSTLRKKPNVPFIFEGLKVSKTNMGKDLLYKLGLKWI